MTGPLLAPEDAEFCAEIGREVVTAAKYRELAPRTIERAALLATRSHRDDLSAAVKYAKGKLHQWVGAYRDPDVRRFGKTVDAFLASEFTAADVEPFALRALARHASTAERIAEMPVIYPRLFESIEATAPVASIVDLCGGLHAFALPFFAGDRALVYRGFDCDGSIVAIADRFVRAVAADARVERRDMLADPPNQPCDVAWLFKSAPCLERQEAGAARRLLEAVPARVFVLSFPNRSLGGRDKGMVESYREFAHELAAGTGRSMTVLEFDCESFYLLRGTAP